MFEGFRTGRRVSRDLDDGVSKVTYGFKRPDTCSLLRLAVAREPTRQGRRQAGTEFGIRLRRRLEGNKPVYVGIGTIVVIVIIVLVILMLRRR